MATPEEKRIVVIATDGSDHSDYAFDCEYFHFFKYLYLITHVEIILF
jgi:hypothetical protein